MKASIEGMFNKKAETEIIKERYGVIRYKEWLNEV
jgi:hypothetical protein